MKPTVGVEFVGFGLIIYAVFLIWQPLGFLALGLFMVIWANFLSPDLDMFEDMTANADDSEGFAE